MKPVPLHRYILALVVILVGLAGFRPAPNPVRGGTPDTAVTVGPGTVLVKFKSDAATASLADRYGASIESTMATGVHVLKVPEGEEWAVSRALAAEPGVLFAEPDILWAAVEAPDPAVAPADPGFEPAASAQTPNDPYYAGRQWAHTDTINSESAWDLTTGDTDIVIAVVDTGIDSGHPDLASKLVPGHTYLDQGATEDANPVDLNGHGTHVAGIAAAVTNNSTGVAGMSWGAKIMPVRVLGRDGTGWTSDIARGIIWAYQNGADVINLSLGSEYDSQSVRDAIEAAHDAGSLLVAAMGNSTSEDPFYPAAHPDTLAVSATNPEDDLTYYSNYGSNCDVAAPGGELYINYDAWGIYSTLPTYNTFYLHTDEGYQTTYDYLQGTSQAAPFVAGLASLVWSLDDTLTPDQVQEAIEETAVDLGPQGKDKYFGHGRIDARAALDFVNLLGAPTLQAIANPENDGSYRINWSEVDRAASYVLQQDDNPGFSTPTIIADTTSSSFNVTNQLPGFWYYRVRATNGSGPGPWSDVKRTGVVPPAPTLDAIASPDPDTYRLSWSSVFGAQTYRLVESDNLSFTGAITRYLGASQVYTVTGQPSGTWHYRVEAGGEVGFSEPSNVRSTTATAGSLPVPTLEPINNDDEDGGYVVAWSEVTTATAYVLEESPRAYFDAPIVVHQGPELTHTVTAQPIGRWHYRVRAVDGLDQSPWSAAEDVVVPAFVHLPLVMR